MLLFVIHLFFDLRVQDSVYNPHEVATCEIFSTVVMLPCGIVVLLFDQDYS